MRVSGFEEGDGDVGILGEAGGEGASGDLTNVETCVRDMWIPNSWWVALTPPPVDRRDM